MPLCIILRPSSDFLRHIHPDCIGAFVSGYQYMGPSTHLKKRLRRGYPGINRVDKITKQHDIDHSQVKNLKDKWKADAKMVKAISNLPARPGP